MRHDKHRALIVIIAAFALFLAAVVLVTAEEKSAVRATVASRLAPQMFLLVVAASDKGVAEIRSHGTGILIDQTQGNLVTAKHVVESLKEHTGYALYAKVDSKLYPLEVLWEHERADIAIVRFQSEHRPTTLPQPFTISGKTPRIGEAVSLLGYLPGDIRSEQYACEMIWEKFVCEKKVALTIELIEAGRGQLSLGAAIEELLKFMEIIAEDPQTTLAPEDIFYDHYIAAALSSSDQGKPYYGMSGGAGIDSSGDLFGVFIEFTSRRLTFIPAYEIPDEYLPHPSH